MRYKLQKDPSTGHKRTDMVKRIDDGTFVPVDEANLDYQRYLAWLAEGNEPEPAE